MKKKILVVCALMMSAMLSLTGCGSSVKMDMAVTEAVSSSKAPQLNYAGEFGAAESMDVDMKLTEEQGESQTAIENRKLIKTVDMRVETKTFDQTLASVKNKVSELGGYIESMETYNGSSYASYRSSRNSSMTIRIPEKELETFLATVSEISNVIRRSENVEDVTLTYVDLESHKKVLLTEQETLLNLLKKAESINDIITIESRLSQVRYQIESMESQLRTFDNKIDYSTIYLAIEEVRELTPVKEETVWEQISGGFLESIRDIRDGFVDVSIWFVVNIPYFVVWGVIFFVAVVLLKALRKVRGKKNGEGRKRLFKKKGKDGTSVE